MLARKRSEIQETADLLVGRGVAEAVAEVEEQQMRTTTATKAKFSSRSVTETILGLCATGRFGVREAIAAASQQKDRQERQQRAAHAKRKNVLSVL